jgi:hypothetical protein
MSLPATEAVAEEQPTTIVTNYPETPKVVDQNDAANAPGIQRQSLAITQELGPDPTMLPTRTTPTLLDKPAVARSLKGKEKEWTAVAEKKRPLQLLDMPVDILKEIIEKVGHDRYKLLDAYP